MSTRSTPQILALTGIVGVALSPSAVEAAQNVRTGDLIEVDYSDAGTWNNTSSARGFRGRETTSDDWVETSYPGNAWQFITFQYEVGSTSESFSGSRTGSTYTRESQSFTNTGGVTVVTDEWSTDELEITKTETWDNASKAVHVRFTVENVSTRPAT